MSYKDSE